jgi:hypothetical protein
MSEEKVIVTLGEFISKTDDLGKPGFPIGITFDNAQFDFEIELNSKLPRMDDPDVSASFINFVNCIFNALIQVKKGNIKTLDTFNGCTFNAEARFHTLDNLSFKNKNIFNSLVRVSTGETEVTIHDFEINHFLLIAAPNYDNLMLKNITTTASGNAINGQIELTDSFRLAGGDNVQIGAITCAVGVKIEEMMFSNSHIGTTNFLMADIGKIHLLNTHFDQFFINPVNVAGKLLDIRQLCSIDNLVFNIQSYETLNIFDSSMGALELFGTNKASNQVNIYDVSLNSLVFREVRNNGTISLNRVTSKPDGLLKINSSSLGKTDFILCDFSKSAFDFKNSKITDAFLAETKFPKKITVEGTVDHQQGQLAFGQIAVAYQKQGHTALAQEYQAQEMDALYQDIDLFSRKPIKLSFTKISLFLNKWSNDFGRNWARGLAFSFGIAIVFFWLVIITSKEYCFGFPVQFDEKFVESYLKFINPLRFFETENIFRMGDSKPYITLTWGSYILDFFCRVMVAYGFYQTIQAFRRFGRK